MARFLLFLFLQLTFVSVFAQQYYQKSFNFKQGISKREKIVSVYGEKIFEIIGIENNRNTNKIHIDIETDIDLRAYRNKYNNLEASLVSRIMDIKGDINIKDFVIDSILVPSSIKVQLDIYNGRTLIGSKETIIVEHGKVNIVDLSDFNNSIGDFVIEISEIILIFTERDLLQFEAKVEEIKKYYSYCLLLEYFNNKARKNSLQSDESNETIFVNRIETELIKQYLASLNNFRSLNIRFRDPAGFNNKFIQFQKYLNRYTTLFEDKISSDNGFSDYFVFCQDLIVSINQYLKYSEKLQPSDAIAFKNIAKLLDDIELNTLITTVIDKYDHSSGSDKTAMCIIDNFTVSGLEWKNKSHFTNALIQLNNAHLIAGWVNYSLDNNYYNAYKDIIGGLVTSYLKVGKMAMVNGDFDSGRRYIDNGIGLIIQNTPVYENISNIEGPIADIIAINTEIALLLSDRSYHFDALKLLHLNKKLCSTITDSLCNLSYSAYEVATSNYLSEQINYTVYLIDQGQFPDAINNYMLIHDSITEFGIINFLVEKINNLAIELSDTLIFQSKLLVNASQSELGLEKLLMAEKILEISNLPVTKANSLLYNVAENAILEIIGKAEFQIWKYDIEKAKGLINKAKSYNRKYLKESSDLIKDRLNNIENSLESRMCVDIRNDYNDAIKKATLFIRDQKYSRITDLLNQADNYLTEYSVCDLDETLLNSFIFRNSTLISYLQIYDSLKFKLVNEDYYGVIKTYNYLETHYNNNINILSDVEFISLNNFLVQQNLFSLTASAVEYYLNNNQPEISLDFLKLAQSQNLNGSFDKKTITNLAKMLATRDMEKDIPVKDVMDIYTDGMEQKSLFRLAYLRGRYLKRQNE